MRQVHEEESRHAERQRRLRLVVHHLHVVHLVAPHAVVDAEAERRIVTHLPEQLLFLQALHRGLGKHFLHLLHLHLVATDGVAGDFIPLQLRVLSGHAPQVLHVAEVVGQVEVEALCLQADGGNSQQ